MAGGHEFQKDRARILRPAMVHSTPRNIGDHAIPAYSDAQQEEIERIGRRQVEFQQISLEYDTDPFLYLPRGPRSYFLLQNLDAVFSIFVGFGIVPNQATPTGLKIAAGQAFEPYMIPQNDVWICGTGTGLATLIYAVK